MGQRTFDTDDVRAWFDSADLSVEQQAVAVTAGSTALGFVFAAAGLAIGLTRTDVVVILAGVAVVLFMAGVFAVFRAMLTVARREDGTPLAALSHPLFGVLFVLTAIAVSLFVGVYVGFA